MQLAQNLPPELQQATRQTAQGAASQIPQDIWGRVSLKAASDAIDKANPGGDPGVKFMALEAISKVLAPGELRMWEMFKQQNEQTFRRELQDRTDIRQMERERFQASQLAEREKAQDERLTRTLGARGGPTASAGREKDVEGEISRLDAEWSTAHPDAGKAEKDKAHFDNRKVAEGALTTATTKTARTPSATPARSTCRAAPARRSLADRRAPAPTGKQTPSSVRN